MGRSKTLFSAVLALSFALSGCATMPGDNKQGTVSRFGANPPSEAGAAPASETLVDRLAARRSVIPASSSFGTVTHAVMAAGSRVAEAELQSARLRAKAASKNWLPRIGPDISLTSLGDLVANILIEQTLFDNGRKKAEREFAAADVEVAAVNLSMDSNTRAFRALELYLVVEKARERAAQTERSQKFLAHFDYVLTERVRGGLSDRADLSVLKQKLAAMQSSRTADLEAAKAAIMELNAMAARPLNDVRGMTQIEVVPDSGMALDNILASAERNRTFAAAKAERAGYLPGLAARGSTDGSAGVHVRLDQMLGFGTGASLQAIEAAKEAANRKVAQAEENTNREIARLEARLDALARQGAEARALTQSAKANLELFQRQFEAGGKQAMEVVTVYETYMKHLRAALDLKYDLALARLEIARKQGVLVNGDEV